MPMLQLESRRELVSEVSWAMSSASKDQQRERGRGKSHLSLAGVVFVSLGELPESEREKERDKRVTCENLGMIVDLPVEEKRHVLLHSSSPPQTTTTRTTNSRRLSLEYSISEQTTGDDEGDNQMRCSVNARRSIG